MALDRRLRAVAGVAALAALIVVAFVGLRASSRHVAVEPAAVAPRATEPSRSHEPAEALGGELDSSEPAARAVVPSAEPQVAPSVSREENGTLIATFVNAQGNP